jgi:predicted methyltransferase MtxX (methanogen marker protein 4)
VLHQRTRPSRSPVVVVLSGGNIDDLRWRSIVDGPGAIS